ncbi:cytochrome c oxidase subunit II [Candidatus Rariloculus sp.]|uniref:cytochrome c oxidase subunit II n=1 Tax=Candidatus Rariloculus sp. TaxID=3101265 RepID=UPI003D114E3D
MTRNGRRGITILGRICSSVLVTVGLPQASVAITLDMREGVTEISQRVQALHHLSLAVCVVVGIIVFGAMFYTMFAHRRSKHPTPAKFHESTSVEIIWTIIPTLILVGMAVPATVTLIEIEDNSDPDLTVLVTASQWKWHYQYVEADIGFFSNLATSQDAINNLEEKDENYLLDVDNPLVIPTNKKVRFLMTSGDVIHSWWVPDFAVKQDAVPGYINEAWTRVDVPGVYRGQCTELCGMNHAYMPVVVDVLPEEEFDAWLEDQRVAAALAGEQAVADRSRSWTMAELMPIGEQVYISQCATCHQPDGSGQGITYPALAGSEIANGPVEGHLDRVLNGVAETEMQSWAPQLSDRDIAAVITFERNSFGNATGDVIQPLTVFEAR